MRMAFSDMMVVDALFGSLVWADDGAAFESIEYFGCMKAQHRKVAMPEYATVSVSHTKGMRRVVYDL